MVHPRAMAARAANSTAFLFSTGSAPGSPRQTGHTLVLGAAPKLVEQPQKIFEAVNNWTWTSSPMTGSYLASTSGGMRVAVAIAPIIAACAKKRPLATASGPWEFPEVTA